MCIRDSFGAPLAFEALLAFFLESTFLGLWIFGWDRLPRKIHLASIWLVHLGTVFSAFFILAANSFMQNPVGYTFNPTTNRAELSDFLAVLTNEVQLVTFPHVLMGAYMTAGGFLMGIALYHLRRQALDNGPDVSMYRKAVRDVYKRQQSLWAHQGDDRARAARRRPHRRVVQGGPCLLYTSRCV